MDKQRIELTLPWCPSTNHYLMVKGRSRFLSPVAKKFRNDVQYLCKLQSLAERLPTPLIGRLEVRIKAYAPDRRRRDLDNLCKNLMDSLQHAEMFEDDSQIDILHLERCAIDAPHGRLEVTIIEL